MNDASGPNPPPCTPPMQTDLSLFTTKPLSYYGVGNRRPGKTAGVVRIVSTVQTEHPSRSMPLR